jgi:hypothetical protein
MKLVIHINPVLPNSISVLVKQLKSIASSYGFKPVLYTTRDITSEISRDVKYTTETNLYPLSITATVSYSESIGTNVGGEII